MRLNIRLSRNSRKRGFKIPPNYITLLGISSGSFFCFVSRSLPYRLPKSDLGPKLSTKYNNLDKYHSNQYKFSLF